MLDSLKCDVVMMYPPHVSGAAERRLALLQVAPLNEDEDDGDPSPRSARNVPLRTSPLQAKVSAAGGFAGRRAIWVERISVEPRRGCDTPGHRPID
jgi:hypothetical protein